MLDHLGHLGILKLSSVLVSVAWLQAAQSVSRSFEVSADSRRRSGEGNSFWPSLSHSLQVTSRVKASRVPSVVLPLSWVSNLASPCLITHHSSELALRGSDAQLKPLCVFCLGIENKHVCGRLKQV